MLRGAISDTKQTLLRAQFKVFLHIVDSCVIFVLLGPGLVSVRGSRSPALTILLRMEFSSPLWSRTDPIVLWMDVGVDPVGFVST